MVAPSDSSSPARRLEVPLAAGTLLITWICVETRLLPTWLDAGPITVPLPSLYPVPLGALAVAITTVTYHRRGTIRKRRLVTAVIGALVVLTAAYAVVVLNVTSGGVFFAGLPPVLLGVVLSVVILINALVETGRWAVGTRS